MLQRSDRNPQLLRSDDTLLLVIDLQEPFLRGVQRRDEVVDVCGRLIEGARVLRVPIVPTLQNSARMGPIVPEISERLPNLCIPFDKMAFSCAEDDACMSEILRSGRRQVLICGVETHICVSQTAHDLLTRGLQVHVAADAVSSRSQINIDVGLRRIERAGGHITSCEMALYEMMVDATGPEFRDILRLVK